VSGRQVTEHLWVNLIPAAVVPEDDPIEAYASLEDRVTGDVTTFDVAVIPALITALRFTYNEAMGLPESSVRQ
jgi:hypothetical protein